MEDLRAKYRELSEKVEQRKRLKTNGNNTNGNQNGSGGVGRGERLNVAQRERMRLLTTAAFDRGKGEDTFGSIWEFCGVENDGKHLIWINELLLLWLPPNVGGKHRKKAKNA